MPDINDVLYELAAMEARLDRRLSQLESRLDERFAHQEATLDSIAATLLSPEEISMLGRIPITAVKARVR